MKIRNNTNLLTTQLNWLVVKEIRRKFKLNKVPVKVNLINAFVNYIRNDIHITAWVQYNNKGKDYKQFFSHTFKLNDLIIINKNKKGTKKCIN